MSFPMHGESELSRRNFLALGGSIAAAGTLGGLIDPWAALGATKWPKGHLGARDALRVKESQFMPVRAVPALERGARRGRPSGQKGLRATGTAAHEGYVDDLRDDLARAGVKQLHFEKVPMRRWTTTSWSLDVAGAPVRTASYIPYSGQTPAAGVTGPLAYVEPGSTPAPGSLAGRIAVFDVPLTVIPLSFFVNLSYEGRQYDPRGELKGDQPYKRPYLNGVIPILEALRPPARSAPSACSTTRPQRPTAPTSPTTGSSAASPASTSTARPARRSRSGPARRHAGELKLPAQVKTVKSRNLIGFIPARVEGDRGAALPQRRLQRDRGQRPGGDRGHEPVPRAPAKQGAAAHDHDPAHHRPLRRRQRRPRVRQAPQGRPRQAHQRRADDRAPRPARVERALRRPDGLHRPQRARLDLRARLQAARRRLLRRAQARQGVPGRRAEAAERQVASGDPNDPRGRARASTSSAVGGMPTANYITGPTYLLNWGITTDGQGRLHPRPHRGDRLHRDDPPARPHAARSSCARTRCEARAALLAVGLRCSPRSGRRRPPRRSRSRRSRSRARAAATTRTVAGG